MFALGLFIGLAIKGFEMLKESVLSTIQNFSDAQIKKLIRLIDDNDFTGVKSNRFDTFIKMVLISEGGHANIKGDLGGETMYGISANANPQFASQIRDGSFTLAQAKEIYKTKYFKRVKGVDTVPLPLAYLAFDARVHGDRHIIRHLQRSMNEIAGTKLKDDGIWGRATANAAEALTKHELLLVIANLDTRRTKSASDAANAVMRAQKRRGLPKRDFTRGFNKRNRDRLTNMNTLYNSRATNVA